MPPEKTGRGMGRKLSRALRRHGAVRLAGLTFERLKLFIHGLRPSVRAANRERERRAREFDRRFGVDTGGLIAQSELDEAGPNQIHAVGYGASDPGSFMKALDGLALDFRQFVFIDFGSGKGRAILMAAEFPFKRIVGIEFSKGLHDIAQANIARSRHGDAPGAAVESLWMDAADYVLPPENLVCYFCNPFDAVMMQRIVAKICDSLAQDPRTAYVVYYNPVHAGVVDGSGCFRRVAAVENILMWRSTI
jgi:SAM-dependent methyltransferase